MMVDGSDQSIVTADLCPYSHQVWAIDEKLVQNPTYIYLRFIHTETYNIDTVLTACTKK